MSKSTRSFLPVVLAADNFPSSPFSEPYPTKDPKTGKQYIPFHLTYADFEAGLPPVGQIRDEVWKEIVSEEMDEFEYFSFGTTPDPNAGGMKIRMTCMTFVDKVVAGGSESMSKAMQTMAEEWKRRGKFSRQLDGWRNEKYSVYAPRQSSAFKGRAQDGKPFSNFAFSLERSACAIFGLATFGVHLTAYEGEGEDMKIWVPRRSKTKPTFPGLLDNSVAGGIPSGMSPLEATVKECDEEASLPDAFVRSRLKNVGVSTYFYITDDGFLQPEIEYLYDLPLPPQGSAEYIKPKPHDDEVESFALLSVPEVYDALHKMQFKPNCGLILIDFLMRHGLITPENEPNYIELAWRMRRRLAIGVPM